MKVLALASLLLLLLSCSKPEHDIEKGIREMEGIAEEQPIEDTVAVPCAFDTSMYRLTMESLRGIPALTDLRWNDSTKTATATWRNASIRRSKGGCAHFSDDLWVELADYTPLDRHDHWIQRSAEAARHFGIPNYLSALQLKQLALDSSRSDKYRLQFEVTSTQLPENQVLEGLLIEELGGIKRIVMRQYTN